ncbi:MAG: glutathione S-transferase N-terminal domain-containing protein [Gammaproteobacteria bacterium]|nr:glutathione S-transferase N-terminal domain-containing protein [Gammaproteobacteria bacterium]
MKWFIRLFFRTLRRILGPILLLNEKLNTPKGIVRSPEAQQVIDEATRNIVLYQFRTCPFCIKVRFAIKRLSLNIEVRDAQKDQGHRAELVAGSGQAKVPCLRITDENGNVRWMTESAVIVNYLDERFA